MFAYLVFLAWGYVVLMMALAEALSPAGTLVGAFFTLLLYGVGPMALVAYLLSTPLRRKARLRSERQAPLARVPAGPPRDSAAPGTGDAPDGGAQSPTAAVPPGVAPVRKEP